MLPGGVSIDSEGLTLGQCGIFYMRFIFATLRHLSLGDIIEFLAEQPHQKRNDREEHANGNWRVVRHA